MEKFFIITEKSQLYQDYNTYTENNKIIKKVFNDFCEEYGIESSQYIPSNCSVKIVPTEKDRENFKTQLCKNAWSNGIVEFKKNSKITKAWINLIQSKNLKVLCKPTYFGYFDYYGRYKTRLFKLEGTLYGSFETDAKFELPEEFQEIKASEFWKVIEDNNDKFID